MNKHVRSGHVITGSTDYKHFVPSDEFHCYIASESLKMTPPEKILSIELVDGSDVLVRWRRGGLATASNGELKIPYEEFYDWIVKHLRKRMQKEQER